MKTEVEPSSRSPVAVRDWLTINAEHFKRLIRKWRELYIESERLLDPDKTAQKFDFSKRILSEMPLCISHVSVLENAKPPQGHLMNFTRSGSVNLQNPIFGKERRSHHGFLIADNNFIIDFTAAQFVRHGLKPGDRLGAIRELAPELFLGLSEGFVALFGSKQEIKEKLNITYSEQSLRPNE